MKDRLIIITGPTASGKSDIGINLARTLDSSIISADSQQVYKFMDIGTNKTLDTGSVNQYLLDIVNPDENFSVNDFSESANDLVRKLNSEDKIPIVVGGTGFYIDSLLFDMNYGRVEKDENIRKDLKKQADNKGSEFLYKKLLSIDEETAKKYHPNEENRIIRALEIYELTGKKPSDLRKGLNQLKENIDPIIFFLNYDNRDILYERINTRVLKMLEDGLLDEVKTLIKVFSLNKDSQSMAAIGYKEVLDYLDGKLPYDEMVDLIQKNTRHYAKRQITWMKKYLQYPFTYQIKMDILDKNDASDVILSIIKEFYGL